MISTQALAAHVGYRKVASYSRCGGGRWSRQPAVQTPCSAKARGPRRYRAHPRRCGTALWATLCAVSLVCRDRDGGAPNLGAVPSSGKSRNLPPHFWDAGVFRRVVWARPSGAAGTFLQRLLRARAACNDARYRRHDGSPMAFQWKHFYFPPGGMGCGGLRGATTVGAGPPGFVMLGLTDIFCASGLFAA